MKSLSGLHSMTSTGVGVTPGSDSLLLMCEVVGWEKKEVAVSGTAPDDEQKPREIKKDKSKGTTPKGVTYPPQ